MAQRNLSKIVDDNGDEYLIKAKGLEDQVQIALTGDVTGTVTTDLTSDPSISTTIGNGAVTESKLATDSVTVNKIKDGEITKAKLNASVYNETDGTIADGTNSNLATKTQVKAYVEGVISSEGHYKGVQSVATINTWTAANLHNGDRVITSSDPAGSGTGTLTLGNLPVVDGQEVTFYVSDDQSVKIWQSSEGNYKMKQAAVSDPTASGTTLTAIATISQNANGEITATKKTIQSATTSQQGVVQLAGSVATTVASENNKAASEKAVRDAIDALDIEGVPFDGGTKIFRYGTCSTAANTPAKTATLSNSMSFSLEPGASVFIKFTNSNTATNPTLSVNNSTAKAIYRYGSITPGTTEKTSWKPGSVVHLVYDGNYWQMVGWLNDDTTYTNASLGQGYGTCATAEATAAKVVTLSGYTLVTGGIVAVKFTYGLCASATMNINSKGAKSIFIDGAAVTAATAKRVLAGDIAYFIYDGTQYQFLGTDKAERKFDINYRASDNALVFTKAFGTAS